MQRLCGICPVSHHLCAAKAVDRIVGGENLTPTGREDAAADALRADVPVPRAALLPPRLARPAVRLRRPTSRSRNVARRGREAPRAGRARAC
ncbi:MAG: hypothetical protein MZU79_06560 [Anaerotruncus sp.]|nr:hypothetical protein [Anaerotruncus sp.]